MAPIREQALMLGPRKSLVAILTAAPDASADRPVVVILNAGIIHHVGPNRLHVLLARELAAAGHVAVRVDISGVGDSAARDDGLAPLDATLADIRDLLDCLQELRGATRFVLVGLCSGADHAVVYSGSDLRVAGVVLLDPHVPRTPGYFLKYYGSRILHVAGWLNFMRGEHPLWQQFKAALRGGGRGRGESAADPSPDKNRIAIRQFLTERYRSSVSKGTHLLLVLTDGRQDLHNHPGQFRSAFSSVPFGDLLTSDYFDGSDHTFSLEVHRARLIELVARWLSQKF